MMGTSIAFKSKLSRPCQTLLRILKFKLRRPIFKSSLRRRRRRLFSLFRWKKPKPETDEVAEVKRVPAGRERRLFPSPLTPAFAMTAGGEQGSAVVEACRSFENYVAEMVVEEGEVRDLRDVEELLWCWRNLRCPVFHDLLCSFYGELCMDLFSGKEDQERM